MPKFPVDDTESTRTDKLLDFVEVARGLKNDWVRNVAVGMKVITRMMIVWNRRKPEEVLLGMVLESKAERALDDFIDGLCRTMLSVSFLL